MKRITHVNVVGITDVQHKMFGACFEGYIVNKYGFANVPRSGFKYTHCDLANPFGYLTITLIVGSSLVSTFFPHLNVGSFIRVFNLKVTFRNKFKRANWESVLKVGATTIIEHIDPFCLLAICPYAFNIKFYAKGKFGGTKNHGVSGHWDIWVIYQGFYPGSCRWVG